MSPIRERPLYRYAGGKSKIQDGVVARVAARITETARLAVQMLSGPERVSTAIFLTVHEIRPEPLRQLMITSVVAAPVKWPGSQRCRSFPTLLATLRGSPAMTLATRSIWFASWCH